MITKTINNSDLGIENGTIQFPNAYCFAFNPNYIFLELGENFTSVKVIVTGNSRAFSVVCSLFKGSGRCYVSRLMELLFNKEYLSKRSLEVTFNVFTNDEASTLIASNKSIAIWGNMKVGDTFGGGSMTVSSATNHAVFSREVVWFKEYPFKVSLFSPSASKKLIVKENGGTERVVSTTVSPGIFELTMTDASDKRELLYKIELEAETIKSSFTNVFDKTFTGAQYKYLDELLKVTVSDQKEGYYIRWIDQYGFLEYWLFRQNTLTNKNKLGSTSIDYDEPIDGVYYANHERTTSIENTTTIKCGAINLTRKQYKTVSSIVASPHIDLFKGYSMDKTEIWIPINIAATSYKQDETKELQDFELQFTMPDTASQTL